MRKFASKQPKLAKIGQNFAFSVQKTHPLTKSTSAPVVAVVTNMSSTLAFEDANLKLLDIVSVADVDAEERVDDSLAKILNMS